MPELPEVHALAADLRTRLDGRAIARVDLAAFSALKTYDPPLSALSGALVDGVSRHGKFLDLEASGLHLVVHLSRAGWIRWRDEVRGCRPSRGSKSPLAARIVLDDGSGLDVTEAGTQQAAGDLRSQGPARGARRRPLGPDPMTRTSTLEELRRDLRGRTQQIKGRAAPPGRRSPASATPTATRSCTRPG